MCVCVFPKIGVSIYPKKMDGENNEKILLKLVIPLFLVGKKSNITFQTSGETPIFRSRWEDGRQMDG